MSLWISAVLMLNFIVWNVMGLEKQSYCVIRDHDHDVKMNFSIISNMTEDHVILDEHSGEKVRMHLCSPLKNKCNGADGYNICLIKNNEEKGIGKGPPTVYNDNGKIQFKFTGDTCKDNISYTVNIFMKCDYSATHNSVPEMFPHLKDDCEFYIIWNTNEACHKPEIKQNCIVIDQYKRQYDLSPLMRLSDNYVFPIGNNMSEKVIMNVCHAVIYGYQSVCYHESGACLVTIDENKKYKYINLGNVKKAPFFENGTLKINYNSGDVCEERVQSPEKSATFTFVCDPEAINTLPNYLGGKEECNYNFIWKTKAACDNETLLNHSIAKAERCTAVNPVTNFKYNLTSLMNKDFRVNSSNSEEYIFRICGSPSLSGKICPAESGICLTKNGTSAGTANTNLQWRREGPYLNYTDGALCGNGQRRYTLIIFLCGVEGSSNASLITEDEPCSLVIYWKTDLVCIKCATSNGEIDLTPLIRPLDNYIVKAQDTEFYINICRPLVSTQGLNCPHGSAICQALRNAQGQLTNETNLGFPEESPQLNGNATQHYPGGSECPENHAKQISSNFTFLCDINIVIGSPKYKGYTDCVHMFEWKTSIVCGSVVGEVIPPCTIKSPLLSHEFNLTKLYENRVYYVKSKQEKQKDYSISICGGNKSCNGSAVCQGPNRYGSLEHVMFDYRKDVIQLYYSNGTKCNNSSYTSVLLLKCNTTAGIGEPTLHLDTECSAQFEMQTNVTCMRQNNHETPVKETTNIKDSEDSKEHTSTYASITVSVVSVVLVVGAVLMYVRSRIKKRSLHGCLHYCSSGKGNGRVQYYRVNTTEEARLLLDSTETTHCQTDSDDELLGL
ncbi:cation-independent mannose-6-phosphate receptor isoform X1 [Cephus cinctus]|uniref:Cation-independent mannose-6-phosphate receptor isoform X1 n=2 Tax=Cephus cinctus TaxID=211228 RepID=A0AAJ7VYY2_CEPCN|nr:cation-independent mannose-6-phosphate receptor isoform X1 [Cephus cinctus]XP_024938343.1 cation-independent mannose-6-phosphate receptor isoform X1 [Cephus cinctus]XP_024938344.1 cation-independent mannose-6-phosphate receptor isoform X1 [Cephus cinctus]